MLKRLTMTSVHQLMRLYWFVRRPKTAGVRAIALTPEGRVILIMHSYIPGWHLPGGGIRQGEGSSVAVLRELREELGLISHGSVDYFAEYHHIVDFRDDDVTLFVVRDVIYVPRRSLEIVAVGEFQVGRLPAEASAATDRRMAEFLGAVPVQAEW